MCRRLGVKLCQSAKCPVMRRNYPPGIHGPKGRQRQTEYGMQLAEKQKAKVVYNMLERQFKLTFERAAKMAGDVGQNLIKLLELRLDNIIYRLGLADTRAQARQLVNHGHFLVNNKKVNIPAYTVRVGETITLRRDGGQSNFFKRQLGKIKAEKIPGWLYFDNSKKEAKVLHVPPAGEVEQIFDPKAIVEYYSRR